MVHQAVTQEVYSHPTTRVVTTQLRDIKKALPLRVLVASDTSVNVFRRTRCQFEFAA